ncbi:MAG: TolC family protein [Bacteroidota bacterium]
MKRLVVILMMSFAVFAHSQTKQQYDIGILLDLETEQVAPLAQKLQNEIRAVVGEDAIINFPTTANLYNNYNLQKARQNYDQLINDESIDLILAFGPVNNQIISNQTVHAKPTILFGAVSQDLNNIDINKESSGIENFTYFIESESFEYDIKTFKELTDFKNLGVVVDAPLLGILPLEDTFERIISQLDAGYKLIPHNSVEDITSALDDIDAIYIAGGFFLSPEQNRQLAAAFIEKQLPSFTTNSTEDVVNGIMATNQSGDNIDQFFRRIALTIEAYVNGAKLSEQPVYIEYTPRLTVNYNTAEAINLAIKYSLIKETDFVGEFKNVKSEKNYDILAVIDEVLNKNLSLKSGLKDIELVQQDVRTAKSSYLPSASLSGSATYTDPRAAEVSLGQNPEFSTAAVVSVNQLIFSEAVRANIEIQENLQKAQQENFNTSQLDAISDAANAYFNILILKANTVIQKRNLDLTKTNLKIAEQNFDVGQSGKSDMLRFRSQMVQNTQSLIEAVNRLEQGYIVLNQILNNPLGMEIDVEEAQLDSGVFEQYNYDELTTLLDDPKLREPFINFLTEEAMRNSPELRSLNYNISAVERNIKLSGPGRFLPTLSVQGAYNRILSRSGAGSEAPQGFQVVDGQYSIALNVSIPLFNQNINNINEQTGIIQKDQLMINKDNVELAIDANVRNGVLNLLNQVSNIDLSAIAEQTAKESLELTQVSYSNGAVNIVQLLDAQTNYLNAQLSRVNAVYNFLLNSIQLERTLGYFFLLNSDEENEAFRQRFVEYVNTRN